MNLAEFICCACKRKFKTLPGPGPGCPHCGSLYYEWLDYPRFQKLTEAGREGETRCLRKADLDDSRTEPDPLVARR